MKAKLDPQYKWIALLLLILFVLQATNLWAQEKPTPKKEGTVRIRIEKMENGKRKVLEKTYQSGDVPANIDKEEGWKEITTNDPLFLSNDFMMRFDSTWNDNAVRKPAQAFFFNNKDSIYNNLFVFKSQDSVLNGLRKQMYTFTQPFIQGTLDSLINHSNDNQSLIGKFQNSPFSNMDSLLKQQEYSNSFLFEFNDPQMNQWRADDTEEYIFDENDYSLHEIKDKQGNKKMVITRKKKAGTQSTKDSGKKK
jgi:hypothetical protein